MSRRKVQRGHANHDRWLVSYADFITLMFAFFVVMFASSQADRSKVKRVSESVTKALEDGPASRMQAAVAEMLGGKPDPKTQTTNMSLKGPVAFKVETSKPADATAMTGELLPSLAYLQAQLQQEIGSGKMRISLEPRGLVVSLQQATFFPSGEDTLDPATYPSLEKVAIAMRKLPNPVRLEGHTDAIPIHTARFRSNWELSAARAIAVLDLLTDRFEIPRERLAIAGYADTAPLAANDSEAGRARNRRVDIVILNRQQALTEPVPVATAAAIPPAAQAGAPKTTGVPHAPM
jgi:chemotaxis protein MotB